MTKKQMELLENWKTYGDIILCSGSRNSHKQSTYIDELLETVRQEQKGFDAEIIEKRYFPGCILPEDASREWGIWAEDNTNERQKNKEDIIKEILSEQ